jgi:hypothetical protein
LWRRGIWGFDGQPKGNISLGIFYYLLLFILTGSRFLLRGSGITIGHNTQKYTYHTTLKQNAAHNEYNAKTIKETLSMLYTEQ